MEVGFVGLGRMGMNMVVRLLRGGHRVIVYNRSPEKVREAEGHGAVGATSIADLVARLGRPRAIWVMVPAGAATQDMIDTVVRHLDRDDIIIDGGNSNFHDDARRADVLKPLGLHYVDVGTSGGIWGLEVGYCLMVGGSDAAVKHCEPVFTALAPENGYAHVGPTGSGHYVKMVHNGIEYGLLQAYAEGYEILHASKTFPNLDLEQISEVWQHGSVVRSWLNELAASAFARDASLSAVKGWVADSGEGRWTVQEAIDLDVPAPVITDSLIARFRSRQTDSFGAKVIAALRNEFGGHEVKHS